MSDNRRDFLKKSASMAAALSVGGAGTAMANPLIQNVKASKQMSTMAKDFGMEMSTAYFSGPESNKQLIELAKQMDCFGAVAGVSPAVAGLKNVRSWEYETIVAVKDAWKKL